VTAAVKGNNFLRFNDYPRAVCGIGCGATTFSRSRVRILATAAKNSSRRFFDGVSRILRRADVTKCSDSDEVGKSHERGSHCDKQNSVRNEIREDHKSQPTDQWDNRLLLLAVHKKAEADGAEKPTPKNPRCVHGSLTLLNAKDVIPSAVREVLNYFENSR
jgi:hypothetical protein